MAEFSLPTHKMFRNLTGQQFGRWTVVSFAGMDLARSTWNCRCECGVIRVVLAKSLIKSLSRSCGCYKRDVAGLALTTHGQTGTSEYNIWTKMRARCNNPTNNQFHNYGGKGITVCERWLNSFAHFFADMGPKPTPTHSIDRIDNKLGYFKDNCRWATPKQQAGNTSQNVWLELNGERMIVADWAIRLGVNSFLIYTRLRRGWTVDRTLTTPFTR